MKQLRSNDAKQNAERLAEIIQLRKACQKEEEDLKRWFTAQMAGETLAQAGEYVIILRECSRTSLDREALAMVMGERLKAFERVTEYFQFEIKAK